MIFKTTSGQAFQNVSNMYCCSNIQEGWFFDGPHVKPGLIALGFFVFVRYDVADQDLGVTFMIPSSKLGIPLCSLGFQ